MEDTKESEEINKKKKEENVPDSHENQEIPKDVEIKTDEDAKAPEHKEKQEILDDVSTNEEEKAVEPKSTVPAVAETEESAVAEGESAVPVIDAESEGQEVKRFPFSNSENRSLDSKEEQEDESSNYESLRQVEMRNETSSQKEKPVKIQKRRRNTVMNVIGDRFTWQDIKKINVGSPVQRGDAMARWTEYLVTTKSGDGLETNVYRRYRQFAWLREKLLEIRGVLVPPLPEKQVFGRFESGFIERRCLRLEIFLRRVLANKLLSKDNSLKLFLFCDSEKQFARAMKGDVYTVSESGKNMYTAYRVMKTKILEKEQTENDHHCAVHKEYGQRFEKLCGAIEKTVLNLDGVSRNHGKMLRTLAQQAYDLNHFIYADRKNDHVWRLLDALRVCCNQVSSVDETPETLGYRYTNMNFRDIFDDFSRNGRAIAELVEGRNALNFRMIAEKKELLSRQQNLAGLKASTSKLQFRKETRINNLTTQISRNIEEVEQWEHENDRVTKLLYSQVHGFKNTLPDSLDNELLLFTDFQINSLQQKIAYWEKFRNIITDEGEPYPQPPALDEKAKEPNIVKDELIPQTETKGKEIEQTESSKDSAELKENEREDSP